MGTWQVTQKQYYDVGYSNNILIKQTFTLRMEQISCIMSVIRICMYFEDMLISKTSSAEAFGCCLKQSLPKCMSTNSIFFSCHRSEIYRYMFSC